MLVKGQSTGEVSEYVEGGVINFDLLVQEAIWCDKLLTNRQKASHHPSHVSSVFTRLMLLGKVRAAVLWLSDNSCSQLLKPTDVIEIDNCSSVSVLMFCAVSTLTLLYHPALR